jgi:hypothetical protein
MVGLVGSVEGVDARQGQGFLAATALDFDGDQGVAALEHEIDLQISFAPISPRQTFGHELAIRKG